MDKCQKKKNLNKELYIIYYRGGGIFQILAVEKFTSHTQWFCQKHVQDCFGEKSVPPPTRLYVMNGP